MSLILSHLQDTSRKTVLLVVDVQNDFISGSLALKNCPAGQDGYEVVPVINDIFKQFSQQFDLIVYTLDWHPADHCSFIDNVALYPMDPSSPISPKDAKVFDTVVYSKPVVLKQKLWPSHCVQNSWGSELQKDLKVFVGKLLFELLALGTVHFFVLEGRGV